MFIQWKWKYIDYCRIITFSCLRRTLLSRYLWMDIHLETAWQKMFTANIAVLHWRHIRSSDPLQPCFPSLLVRRELVVAYVCCFTGFCWIIRTSRDTAVHHFLETLTCKGSVTFFKYSNAHYASGRQRAGKRACLKDPAKNFWRSYVTFNCWPM